jgi:hypothetical protein
MFLEKQIYDSIFLRNQEKFDDSKSIQPNMNMYPFGKYGVILVILLNIIFIIWALNLAIYCCQKSTVITKVIIYIFAFFFSTTYLIYYFIVHFLLGFKCF